MRTLALKKCVCAFTFIACLVAWCQPATAISIREEEELAREFIKVVGRHFEFIDDPYIVGYVRHVGNKISEYVKGNPFTYHFYVIKEDVYNAFAIPAGYIFINSGLLAAMDSEEELAGILSHEMAHVACRHISQRIEQTSKINLATMAGVVAGIFLGAATGDPTAMQAMTIGSAAAGQTAALAYSREDETQADQIGLRYLQKAGYSARGLLTILKKIRGKQWFGTDQVPTYMMTHPAVEERIVQIDTEMAIHHQNISAPTEKPSPMFQKAVIRLIALYESPDEALSHFNNKLANNSDDLMNAYGYALVLAREGKRKLAAEKLRNILSKNALDPLFLGDLGRIYFLDGQYDKALSTLSGVVSLTNDNPEAIFYLGRTQMERGELRQAVDSFEKLVDIYPDYKSTYKFLGECYGRLSIMPEAHYNIGIYQYRSGDFKTARYHLLKAKEGITDSTQKEIIDKVLKSISPPAKEGSNKQK